MDILAAAAATKKASYTTLVLGRCGPHDLGYDYGEHYPDGPESAESGNGRALR